LLVVALAHMETQATGLVEAAAQGGTVLQLAEKVLVGAQAQSLL
jgi:hypothetical protein